MNFSVGGSLQYFGTIVYTQTVEEENYFVRVFEIAECPAQCTHNVTHNRLGYPFRWISNEVILWEKTGLYEAIGSFAQIPATYDHNLRQFPLNIDTGGKQANISQAESHFISTYVLCRGC